MKISRKRAPLVLAGAAVAAALVALPATAAADPGKAEPIPHSYDGPDWDKIPPMTPEQNASDNLGLVKAHYNCTTGRLTLAVRGGPSPQPAPQVQASGGNGGAYVSVERLPSKPPDPDVTHKPGDPTVRYIPVDGGFNMSFPLGNPGHYKLHYSNGNGVVTSAGSEPPNGMSGYVYVKISCPTLQIKKTATGRYDHMYDWSVQKAARVVVKDSKTPVVKYDITARKSGPNVVNRDVVGTITVKNDGPIPVPRVRVTDHGIGARDLCNITGVKINKKELKEDEYAKGRGYVVLRGLGPKAVAELGYICHPHPDIPPHKLPKKPVNKASVSWAGYQNGDNDDNGDVVQTGLEPNGPKNIAYAMKGFQFDTLDGTYLESVHLFDKSHAGRKHLGKLDKSQTVSYATKLAAPRRGCRTYSNTAILHDPGNDHWNPNSTAKVKICRSKDGSVKTETKNPGKPSVDYDKRRRCYVNLRARIAGPSKIPAGRRVAYRVQLGNRGKLDAGRVRTRISVSKGMKIVGIKGVSRKQVRIRGRHIYVNHKWVPRGRGRTVVVIVKTNRRIERPVRGLIRVNAKHNCDTARAAKRVIIVPKRPREENGENGQPQE